MKKTIIIIRLNRTALFIVLFFVTIHFGYTQTFSGDLLIDTQAELDELSIYLYGSNR